MLFQLAETLISIKYKIDMDKYRVKKKDEAEGD